MDIRDDFESMVQQYFPNADFTRDCQHSEFYRDQGIQTSWVGFKALHLSNEDTTKGAEINHEDSAGNSETMGAG
ncbi:hypothetical protein [Marinobacter sp. DS40M6]|uniref:hypothetical protein n=1 Tax=Marinobacter sp. DS40M6 TaxID=1597776 RepID=UPI0023596523|nr:hypothetical protein [Marinobacter sp. DS40M6]MDC8457802.1 hypothetical protein [Marinobacter sp. DS40M6]